MSYSPASIDQQGGNNGIALLSIYLREARGFTLEEVGIIFSLYEVGALLDSFLGGWLTDRVGSFAAQTVSLIGGGICFLFLKEVETFEAWL